MRTACTLSTSGRRDYPVPPEQARGHDSAYARSTYVVIRPDLGTNTMEPTRADRGAGGDRCAFRWAFHRACTGGPNRGQPLFYRANSVFLPSRFPWASWSYICIVFYGIRQGDLRADHGPSEPHGATRTTAFIFNDLTPIPASGNPGFPGVLLNVPLARTATPSEPRESPERSGSALRSGAISLSSYGGLRRCFLSAYVKARSLQFRSGSLCDSQEVSVRFGHGRWM